MSYIFKFFLTINSLLLSLVIFLVNKGKIIEPLHQKFPNLNHSVSYFLYVLGVILLTWLSLGLKNFLSKESLNKGSITCVETANDAFLPSYLGYFFVALSVNNYGDFFFVFGVICIFVFYSRISYFNPIIFLFGFNFFYLTTKKGNKVLMLTRRQLKTPSDLEFKELRRINNYTFIDMEKKS